MCLLSVSPCYVCGFSILGAESPVQEWNWSNENLSGVWLLSSISCLLSLLIATNTWALILLTAGLILWIVFLMTTRVMFSKSFSPSCVCGFPMLWTEFPSENGDEQIRFCCRYWFHQILELKPPRVNFVTSTNIMFLSLFSMLCLWVFNVGMELPVWEWNWSSGVGLHETQDSLCFYY